MVSVFTTQLVDSQNFAFITIIVPVMSNTTPAPLAGKQYKMAKEDRVRRMGYFSLDVDDILFGKSQFTSHSGYKLFIQHFFRFSNKKSF